MLETKNSEFLQITHHDRFYSRMLSKESSVANPSFRVYYGRASGAVPFVWESQPGTPKHNNTSDTLPPLTPPPSYLSSNPKSKKHNKNSSSSPKVKTSSLMHCLLPRLSPKRSTLLSSSSSVSSSGCHRSSLSSESIEEGSPNSTLCYRFRHGGNGGLRGCSSMVIMKNALLSIVGGHGSSQGTADAA